MTEKNIYRFVVDVNEEVASIIDRLCKVQEKEIEVFIPNGALMLRSIVNLKLLKKQADKEGKNIFISVEDENLKTMISRSGLSLMDCIEVAAEIEENEDVDKEIQKIKVNIDNAGVNFASVDSIYRRDLSQASSNYLKRNIEASNEKKSFLAKYNLNNNNKANMDGQKKGFFSSFGFKLFFFFLLASLILATIVILLVLPTVDIKITTQVENMLASLQLNVDSSVDEINFSTYTIPGHLVETAIEESQEFSATGEKTISEKATGKITVYNEWSSQSQTLVKTTRFLSSSGKLFRTVETVIVPGAAINSGRTIPGAVVVKVEADEDGDSFNVGPSDFTIPGFEETVKYSTIYGKSTEPMTGGKTKIAKVVSADDISKARQTLVDACSDKASEKLKNILSERKAASDNISDNLKLLNYAINEQVISESSSLQIGEEGEKFIFSLKVKAQGIVFDEDNLKVLAQEYFSSSMSDKKESMGNNIELSYKSKAKTIDFDKGKMAFDVDISQNVRGKIGEENLKNMISGKGEDQLKEFFSDMDEVEKVEVSFWPFWVKKVPVSNEKINIYFE